MAAQDPATVPDGDVPLGLQELMNLEHIHVKQRVPDGVFCGCRYDVLTLDQRLVLRGHEVSVGSKESIYRPFKIIMYDFQNKEIVRLIRPERWYHSKMVVAVMGHTASIVREKPTFFDTVLCINDAEDFLMLKLKRSYGTAQYQLLSACYGQPCIGHVTQIDGAPHDVLYCGVGYYLQFPRDLTVQCKAAVIAATILIDFLQGNSRRK